MIYNENPITREAIDKLLKKNASIQASLGTDSTEVELFEAKFNGRRYFAKSVRSMLSLRT